MNLDTAPLLARSIALTPPQAAAKARVGTAAGKRQRVHGVATRSHAQQRGPAVDDEVELYNVQAQVWVPGKIFCVMDNEVRPDAIPCAAAARTGCRDPPHGAQVHSGGFSGNDWSNSDLWDPEHTGVALQSVQVVAYADPERLLRWDDRCNQALPSVLYTKLLRPLREGSLQYMREEGQEGQLRRADARLVLEQEYHQGESRMTETQKDAVNQLCTQLPTTLERVMTSKDY